MFTKVAAALFALMAFTDLAMTVAGAYEKEHSASLVGVYGHQSVRAEK